MKLGHFNKHFVKNTRKMASQGNILEFFSPRYSWNYILNGKFNPKMDTIRIFISKIRTLFSIFKKAGEASPPSSTSSCALVSVAEYASISLNTPKYPWKNAWINCFDYNRTLNMHDHLTCWTVFWRCLRFWISQGFEYCTVV